MKLFRDLLLGMWDFWVHDLASTLRDSDDYVSLPRLMWFLSGLMMFGLFIAVLLGRTIENLEPITNMITAAFATGATAYVGKKGADTWKEKIQSAAKSAAEAVASENEKQQEGEPDGDL